MTIDVQKTVLRSTIATFVGFVIGVISFAWSVSADYTKERTTITNTLQEHDRRIAEIEKIEASRTEVVVNIREAIARLSTQLTSLNEAIQETRRDIKDIRTAIR